MKRLLLVPFLLAFELLGRSPAVLGAPEDDPFHKGMAALQRRNVPEAIEWLKKVPDFSATDNFLGALKGHPNVTILGTASSGGSGRMQLYKLPKTKLRFTLSQMASYSRTGQLYDGHGVQPDVVVEPTLSDRLGKTDTVLEAALKRLEAKP